MQPIPQTDRMLIGYARVSTASQNLDRQTVALEQAGCVKIFKEVGSGKTGNRRVELEKALSTLDCGDTLILAEWDRATRSMMDGIAIIQNIANKGAFVKALDRPWCDLTTATGKGILAFLSAMAEDERERILKRAAEGREIARSRGVIFGRKQKLTPHQIREVKTRLRDGTESFRTIARSYNVSHHVISRIHAKMVS